MLFRFFVFFIGVVFLFSCENDIKHTAKEKNKLGARVDVGSNIEVYYSEKGIQTALLKAPVMMKQEDSQFKTMFPKGIHLQMFDSVGQLASTMTAKYGEHDHTTNQMKAHDSVLVVSTHGQILKAKDLIWLSNENKMVSYGAVEMRTPTEIIYGDTLFADENLKRYLVKKVRGVVQVKK